jgi:deoxyribonuclease V
MHVAVPHSWRLTPKEAVQLQRQLAQQVDVRRKLRRCKLVAAADASYSRFSSTCYVGVVVTRLSDMEIVEQRSAVRSMVFPYIPGLLSFREGPPILDVLKRIRSDVDVLLIDGQGIAHPRRLGIASHVGLCLDCPTIGCAKSVLVGTYDALGVQRGSSAALVDRGEVIGSVLRTRDKTKPVFVSVGHGISLESATHIVLECCNGCRLPEPARQAHAYVNELRRSHLQAL